MAKRWIWSSRSFSWHVSNDGLKISFTTHAHNDKGNEAAALCVALGFDVDRRSVCLALLCGGELMMFKAYTLDDAKAMSLDDAKRAIERNIYEAAALLEKLEQCGKCYGNGHHARQKLATLAAEEIESRWKSA